MTKTNNKVAGYNTKLAPMLQYRLPVFINKITHFVTAKNNKFDTLVFLTQLLRLPPPLQIFPRAHSHDGFKTFQVLLYNWDCMKSIT